MARVRIVGWGCRSLGRVPRAIILVIESAECGARSVIESRCMRRGYASRARSIGGGRIL